MARRRSRLLWTAACVAACGRISFQDHASPGDSGSGDGGSGGGSGSCDPTAPFGTPVELASLDPDGGIEGTLRLLPDELTGYYWSSRGHGSGGETYLYRVTRPDLAAPFTATAVEPLNVANANEVDPTPTADDALLLYRRNGGGIGDELFMALGSGGAYGSGQLVSALHSGKGEAQPFIQLFGDEVYFQSRRTGSGDLYRATRTGSAFSGVTLVAEVSGSDSEEGDPVITPDGLTLYFRSNRPGVGSGFNVWTAQRATTGDAFGPPAQVPNVSSDANEGPSWISPDGCRLYLSSDRSGTNEVYVATRGAP